MKSSEQETLLSLLLLKFPKADELELPAAGCFTFHTNLPESLHSINTLNDSIMATVTDLPTHPAQQQFPVAMDRPFQGPEGISAGKHPSVTTHT
jgi:hypothetical protein